MRVSPPARALVLLESRTVTCPATAGITEIARVNLYQAHHWACAAISALRHAIQDAAPRAQDFADPQSHRRAVEEVAAELELLEVLARRRRTMIDHARG